jgi:hypothetical protein
MVTYKQRRASYAWIIGILVFALAMIITFSDVYGLTQFDQTTPGNNTGSGLQTTSEINLNDWQVPAFSSEDFYDPSIPTATAIPSVPEPTSMTLLLLGCGFLLAAKRKANS